MLALPGNVMAQPFHSSQVSMMHFVELYHGEFSEERLLRALRSIHPVDIYRIGQDDPAKLRGLKIS